MKKVVFILVAMMALCSAGAQEILVHDKDTAGNVFVASEYFVARDFTDRVVWEFNANLYVSKDPVYDTMKFDFEIGVFFHTLGTKIPVKADGIMLIKLMDNSVIELNCITKSNNVTGVKINSFSFGYSTYVSSNNTYSNWACYSISYNDLQRLKVGVKKVRVQTDNGFIEKEYSKDKCGVRLFNSFTKVIKELQNTPWNSKEKVYENF